MPDLEQAPDPPGPRSVERTIVVVPSLTFPEDEIRKIVGNQFYEERMLFILLSLADPGTRIVYVTSVRVEEPIVDYYLRFVPDTRDAQERLYMISLWDARPKALTVKVVERDDVLERIRALAEGDPLLVTFTCTGLESWLAEATGLPLYGPHPRFRDEGSKSGARRIAAEAGVATPPGAGDLWSEEEVLEACRALRDGGADAAVIKLNYGFSGQGNAILDLRELAETLEKTPTVFCASDESWESYGPKISRDGVVVEQLLREPGIVSPSVQMRISGEGWVEVLSTHDQILGGPDNQVYLGCRFPADATYRDAITAPALAIGGLMARRGVTGMFGLDLIVRTGDEPEIFLSEINLRLGGTTHPFLMARAVTEGRYDEASGELLCPDGPRCYVATDNFKWDELIGLEPQVLIRALDDEGLAFDKTSRTGVLLHLLGSLKKHGKVGATCVATSHIDAAEMYSMLESLLVRLGRGLKEGTDLL